MKYVIVHDTLGRVRLRCGRYAFDLNESHSIVAVLKSCAYIKDIKASSVNGSLLIYYRNNHYNDVLASVEGLNVKELTPVPLNEQDGLSNLQSEFQFAILKKFLIRTLARCILPNFIGRIYIFSKASAYIFRGVKSLLEGKINVDVLDASSIGISLAMKNFSTAGSIMFLLSISEQLEDYTRKKTKLCLSQSLHVAVNQVWKVVENGKIESAEISDINIGDLIQVQTGATIPVDGIIFSGEAYVNESCMTGESLAVLKKKDTSVFAGTVIEDGTIIIEVHALGNGTRMNAIIGLIDQSELLKAEIVSKAETLADAIVPFSFLVAGGIYLLSWNAIKAASVLLVDYSCAIKLATPIAVISAMREAAQKKIIVKGGKFLEGFAKADTLIFDKTGTLTTANPQVCHVVSFSAYSEEEILRTAACLEEHFPHSVARAIVRKAEELNLHHQEEHAEVSYIVAHGIRSKLNGEEALIGSWHFIVEDEKVIVSEETQKIIENESLGKSTIFLALGGKLAGMICIDDPIRKEAKSVIKRLYRNGFNNILMLTGDSEHAAKNVAHMLGIKNYRAQVLPEDKVEVIKQYQENGHCVVMIGDGVNDTPALATANVSVSMKESSDIAREVADVSLMTTDLNALVDLRHLSTNLLKRIKNTYKHIVTFNTSLMIFGLGNFLNPAYIAFLHNVSTMVFSTANTRRCLPAPEISD